MLQAKDVMSRTITTISQDSTLVDASELLDAKGITGMPVVDSEGKVSGIITEIDILNFAFKFVTNLHNIKVREAMTKNVVSFTSDTGIDRITECFSKSNFRRVPIIDDGRIVGIISRRDIIHSLIMHNFENGR